MRNVRTNTRVMVFDCEQSASFTDAIACQDEGRTGALVRMFDQALKLASAPSADRHETFRIWLDKVRRVSHRVGYGAGVTRGNILAADGIP